MAAIYLTATEAELCHNLMFDLRALASSVPVDFRLAFATNRVAHIFRNSSGVLVMELLAS